MKISKITIKQLFGIKEWQGDGKNIELVGDNGTGKTSVIDAIRYALTNSSDREFIVKNGETEGEIYIETDNGLSIDRKARTAMTDYKSVKQNGNVIPSPESFLKTIFTPLQLSPMEFISMDKKTQNATILDMIQYDWNLDTIKEWFGEIPRDVNYEQNILAVLNDIQAENGYYFMHRQDVNRDIRAKKAVIADIGSSLPIDYDGERWEKENLSDLYTEIEKIRKNNETIEKAKRLRDSHDGKIRSFQADKEIKIAALDTEMAQQEKNIESELAQLEERIKALREKKDGLAGVKADKVKVIQSEYEASVSKYEAEQASYAEYADMETTPIDDLMAKANETEKMKGHINEWRRMLNIQKEVDELQSESNSLTEKIELARTLPGTILETAEIPIEGLTVKDGIPLINGLPVSNLSEGEKLDLCIDVAIQNPAGLQIILIDGTEKLSEENRTLPTFSAQHPEIFSSRGKTAGELKAEYKQASAMIDRAEKDKVFMQYMAGDKQVIMTGEINGIPVKIKIDSCDGKRITDLKTVKSVTETFYAKDLGQRLNFCEWWGYDLQGAVYREIYRQNTGKLLPFYICAISKDKTSPGNIPHPRIKVIEIPPMVMDEKLAEFQSNIIKVQRLKDGEIEPLRCEVCDYCADTEVLDGPISMDMLMGEI